LKSSGPVAIERTFLLTWVPAVCILGAFMKAALTIQRLTRSVADVVVVPRGQRMSWQVSGNYQPTGEQEEQT